MGIEVEKLIKKVGSGKALLRGCYLPKRGTASIMVERGHSFIPFTAMNAPNSDSAIAPRRIRQMIAA
jgi:hypothetical protein